MLDADLSGNVPILNLAPGFEWAGLDQIVTCTKLLKAGRLN